MIINADKKFLFIHIQKTGGTSIKHQLLKCYGSAQFHYPHTMLRQISLKEEEKHFFKFAFVRNPWDRLYSWYKMIMNVKSETIFFQHIRDNASNFSEFLDLTEEIIDTVPVGKTSDTQNIKSIATNQLEYILDKNGQLGVDFIGKFEQLQDDFNMILQKLHLPVSPLPHLNKTDNRNYRTAYSDNDIEKVFNLYKTDIVYFKYDF